jgi:hypothetical protein
MSSHKRARHPHPLRTAARSRAPEQARTRGLLQIQSSAGNRAAVEFLARSVDQIQREKAPPATAAAPPAPAAPRKAQFGIPADTLAELRAFAKKHGVRLYVRQPNPHSAAHIEAGAAPKPMEVKAKTINFWDTHLHPKIGLEQRGLVGFFEAELPKDFHSGKYTKRQRRKIRQRRKMRLEEFGREGPSMKVLEGTAPDRGLAVRVKDGVVYQVEPDSVRRFEGGPHERRPRRIPQPAERLTALAGDIDVFDLTDMDGKPLSRARYAAMDTALVEAGLTEHGAHMRWKARGTAARIKRSMMVAHALASGGVDQLVRIAPDGLTRVEAAEFERIWPEGYKRAKKMERRKARKVAKQARKEAKQARKGAKQARKKALKKRKRKTKRRADKKKSTKKRRKAARARRKAGKVKTPSAPTVDTPAMKKPPKIDLGDIGSAKVKLPGGGRRLAKILSGAVVQAVLEMVITELIQGPYRRELALATRIQTTVARDLEDRSNAGFVARNDRLYLHFPWYLETRVVAEDWKDALYMFSGLNMQLYEEPNRAYALDGQTLQITASPKSPYRSGKRKVRDEKGSRYHTYQQVASVIVHDASAVTFVKQLAREEQAIRKRMVELEEQLRGMYLDGAVPARFAWQFRKVSKSIDVLHLRAAVAHLEALARMVAKEDDLFPLLVGSVVDDIVARQQRLKRSWGMMDSDSHELASATAGERTVSLALD